MLNRIALCFYFFYFSPGGAGGTREHRWFPFFCSCLIFMTTSSRRITVKPALLVCVFGGSFVYLAHAFFSALCFHPLKHAPLVFGEENQA